MANGFFGQGLVEGFRANDLQDIREGRLDLREQEAELKRRQQLFEEAKSRIEQVDEAKKRIVEIATNQIKAGGKVPKRIERLYDTFNSMGNRLRKQVGIPRDPGLFKERLASTLTPQEKAAIKGQSSGIERVSESRAIEGMTGKKEFTTQVNPETGQMIKVNNLTGEPVAVGKAPETFTIMDPKTGKTKTEVGLQDALKAQEQGGVILDGEGATVQFSGNITDILSDDTVSARRVASKKTQTEKFIRSGVDMAELLRESPNANTFVARGGKLIDNAVQEAEALMGALQKQTTPNGEPAVEEDVSLDPTQYDNIFEEFSIQNSRMRGLLTSLAFQAAAAEAGQEGRAVSNRDIERFMKLIGADNANPKAIMGNIIDVAERLDRGFRIFHNSVTNKRFEEELGLEELRSSVSDSSKQRNTQIELDVNRINDFTNFGYGPDVNSIDDLDEADREALRSATDEELKQLLTEEQLRQAQGG